VRDRRRCDESRRRRDEMRQRCDISRRGDALAERFAPAA
jgi:hypothetical protein